MECCPGWRSHGTASRISAILCTLAAADGTLRDMAKGTDVPDESYDPYEGLDADERAEARAAEARLAQTPDAWGPPPREAGTVLRFRSMWTVVGAVMIAGSVVGAVSSQQFLICGVIAAIGLLMTSRGLGSVPSSCRRLWCSAVHRADTCSPRSSPSTSRESQGAGR
jgi:hypothetical protein